MSLRKHLRSEFRSVGRHVRWSWNAAGIGKFGAAAALPLIAFSAAHAPRGRMLETATSGLASAGAYPLFSGAMAAGLSLMIPGAAPAAIAVAGTVLALYPSLALAGFAGRQFRRFSELDRKVRRLEMGGSMADSPNMRALRFRSLQEMSGSIITARRFLGNEALFLRG